MFCENCGAELIEGNAFCTGCGQKVAVPAVREDTEPVKQIPEQVQQASAEERKDGRGTGKAALIVGLIGAVLAALTLLADGCSCGMCGWDDACVISLLGGFAGFVPLVLGIVGVVLSIMAMKRAKKTGTADKNASIGLILSVIALVLTVLSLVLAVFLPTFATIYTAFMMDRH